MQPRMGPMFSAAKDETPTASLYSHKKIEDSFPSSTSSTDEWFREEFEGLYDQVANFVNLSFCQFDDVPFESGLSPWNQMSPEFIRYSAMVAEADESLGDWDRILTKRTERWYLLVGILARALEAKVFGELLFGGSKSQKRLLENLERSSLEVEGFGRTEVRASNVDAILGDLPTPNFDIDVTRLSKQIIMLFQPLNRFLEDSAAGEEMHSLSSEGQFRSIHEIVVRAAHLSVRIRLSPTVFYFHSESPGNLFDADDQIDMGYQAYVASKSAVAGMRSNQDADCKPYRALVRFALWPSIKRYSAGIGSHGHEMGGFRVYNISRSRVVYYWGLEDRGQRTSTDLQTFIEQRRKERRSTAVNVASATVGTIGTTMGRAMERLGGFQFAVLLAVGAYLAAKDYAQGKDPFRWQ